MSLPFRVAVAGAGVFGLASALALARAGAVVTLHDPDLGRTNASAVAAGMLAPLTRATDWVWITGNHDAPFAEGEADNLAGGTLAEELEIAGMILRHQARPGETRPEFSGHYHPRLQITVRQRHIRRPCAVVSRDASGSGRMILPAFGALTGGMNAADPAIIKALQPANTIHAMLPAGGKLVKFALWQDAA